MDNIVKGYRHTGIICEDIEKSLYFYKDLLGFRVIQDFWDDSDYINKITGLQNSNVHMIKLEADDGTVLELLEYVTHPTSIVKLPIHNVGLCHLALQVRDIKKAYKNLSNNDVEFISEPILSSEGIAIVCFCIDPNGMRIELVEML
jgi:catechol 2,3-dioxygenase-like lactoylglutathione lyase family enzyme|tara:strand:- start:3629 stop:4066 length:438 start_codon:yes stop_codon:yes gene_type:complete